MKKWLKRKLGILSLQTRVAEIEKDLTRIYKSQNVLENKTRTGRALRQDEVNRARKRRYKGA